MIGFTSEDEQVNLSHKLRKIFKYYVITNLFLIDRPDLLQIPKNYGDHRFKGSRYVQVN